MLQNVFERTLQKNLNSLKFYCRIHPAPKIYAPMTLTWNLIEISRLHPFSPPWDNCKVFISKKMHVLTSKTVTVTVTPCIEQHKHSSGSSLYQALPAASQY
jgi:hypothetical protein